MINKSLYFSHWLKKMKGTLCKCVLITACQKQQCQKWEKMILQLSQAVDILVYKYWMWISGVVIYWWSIEKYFPVPEFQWGFLFKNFKINIFFITIWLPSGRSLWL